MTTAIQNSTSDDLDEIFRLQCIATDFQKAKAAVHWPEFDRQMIGNEILENRQWKIEIDGKQPVSGLQRSVSADLEGKE